MEDIEAGPLGGKWYGPGACLDLRATLSELYLKSYKLTQLLFC